VTLNALICDLNYDVPYPKAQADGFEGVKFQKSAKINVSVLEKLLISWNENKYRRLICKQNSDRKINRWLNLITKDLKVIAKTKLDSLIVNLSQERRWKRLRQPATASWKKISFILNSLVSQVLGSTQSNLFSSKEGMINSHKYLHSSNSKIPIKFGRKF
jgi:hypothetical protein